MPLGIVLLRSTPSRLLAPFVSLLYGSLLLLSLLSHPLLVHSSLPSAISPQQLELIKRNFLSQLGLQEVPLLARPSVQVPAHMWELYEKMQTSQLQSEWIRHYYPKSVIEENEGLILSYNLSLAAWAERANCLTRADLKLRLRGDQDAVRVQVYALDPHRDRRLLASIETDEASREHSNREWTDIDVTEAVRGLQRDGMTLLVKTASGTTLTPSPSHSLSSLPHSRIHSAPLILFCESREKGSKTRRRKREAPLEADEGVGPSRGTGSGSETVLGHGEGSGSARGKKGKKQRKQHSNRANNVIGSQSDNLCARRSLYVDFEELNWQDWIMAPKGYEAGECSGECIHPMPAHLNATNHAIIQSLIHSLNPSLVPAPCCVPAQTIPLSILYVDVENVITIKDYENMRVETCGCR